jgi:hypothetical protein
MSAMLSIIAASRRRVDPDAAAYFARIVTAGSSISAGNKAAVDAFVKGCKADTFSIVDGVIVAGSDFRNWDRIKASCLLAGPDDLTGALVPLVGAAPTNVDGNFVAGDYNRTTGLVGDGSTKYLDVNRLNSIDPQNSKHLAVWISSVGAASVEAYIGCASTTGASAIRKATTNITARCNSSTLRTVAATISAPVLFGTNRADASNITIRLNGASNTYDEASASPLNNALEVFRRGSEPSNARLSYYSIGESLDLEKLDARLTTYMSAIS